MAGQKHTHKYFRMELNNDSKTRVWACGHGDCSHYTPKHLEQLVLNKKSICWNCGEEFVLDAIAMQRDKPVCGECNPTMTALLSAVIDKLS